MPDERDETVKQFIEESERTLEAAKSDQVFDESLVQQPVSVLEPQAPFIVEPQTPVLEAVSLMQNEKIGCVLVATAGKLKGIVTERDILVQVVGKSVDAAKLPVRKIMTSDPEYLRVTDSVAHALNKMSLGGYRHIPLVDDARVPVGVISVKDIVNYVVRFFPKSVMNLPTLPRQNVAREREGA